MPAPDHAIGLTQTPLGVKPPLLFLCHRIPYPPNKGDKIRSFHLLHHLSRHFDIYLASFVDDPQDWPWAPEVEKYCKAVCLRPLNSRLDCSSTMAEFGIERPDWRLGLVSVLKELEIT